jgi:hypothetical protein
MAKTTETLEVRINTAINAEGTLKDLRELKKLQRETVAGSDDFKRLQARINDIGDATKTAKGQSEDWIDALAGASGPLGSLGRGLDTITSSTNKWGLALKATGIGLIVSLVGLLVKAFSENEKAMKKLEPVMIAFEQILGGIFAALEPVFDAFVDLAIKAMPLVTQAIKVVYVSISTLLQQIGKLGSSIKKLFEGDFAGAWEDAKSSVMDFGKTYEETSKKFDKGASEMTKTQKKNQKEQSDLDKQRLEKLKAILADEEKTRQANLDKAKSIALDGAKTEKEKLEIEKKYALDTYNSKKKLLEDQAKLYPKTSQEYKQFQASLTALDAEYITKKTEFRTKDQELTQKAFQDDIKAAQETNKAKIDDLTNFYNLAKDKYGENSKEARAAQDAIFAQQKQGFVNELALYEQKKKSGKELTKEEVARVKEIETSQKTLTTTIQIENTKRTKSDLDTALKNAETKKAETDALFAENMRKAEGDLAAQQALLDAKKALDEKYYTEQLAREGLTAEQIKAIKDKQTADLKANADAQITIEQKKFDTQQKLLGATAAAINAVADIAGKNTVQGKALAVAASLINTYSAIAAQLKTAAGSPGGAIPGYAIAQAIATGLVGFKAVSDIIGTPVPSSSAASTSSGGSSMQPRRLASGGMVSGPGSGRSDLIPAMLSNGESVINAQSTSMFRPLLSSINQLGGGRKFADGGMAMNFNATTSLGSIQDVLGQSAPIKTYVVAADMTNQQMLDRNIKDRSTL